MYCVNSWADRKRQDEEANEMAYLDAHSLCVSELMSPSGEFFPYTRQHIEHAMAEMQDSLLDYLALAMRENKYYLCGEVISKWVEAYWLSQADKLAAKELEKEHETQAI